MKAEEIQALTAIDMDAAEDDAYEVGYEVGKKAGAIQERQRCMAAVCDGCREGWPYQDDPGEMNFGWHKHNDIDSECEAQPIREMEAKSDD